MPFPLRVGRVLRRHRTLAFVAFGIVLALLVAVFVHVRTQGKHDAAFRLRGAPPAADVPFASAVYQTLGVRMAPGHRATLLQNGAVFDALVADIAQAKSSIHVDIYIWERGVASDRVVAAITERARAGVACRILTDAFGSSDFTSTVAPALVTAGCDVRVFRPIPAPDELARNHRKIVVLDGAVAYTGGFGIRDSWLGDGVHDEGWRDTNVRFEGPAVIDAQQAFAENWQEAGGNLLPAEAFPAPSVMGPGVAAFVASTASPVVTRAERLTQLLVASATKRIWISNAYFVPTRAILDWLVDRAGHGVDVRLLAPGRKSDSKTSLGAQHIEYGDLLERGVRIWEYGPSMMHAKTMVIDDTRLLVGSINLDPLSLSKLDEGALLLEDEALVRDASARFEDDCTHARELH